MTCPECEVWWSEAFGDRCWHCGEEGCFGWPIIKRPVLIERRVADKLIVVGAGVFVLDDPAPKTAFEAGESADGASAISLEGFWDRLSHVPPDGAGIPPDPGAP